MRCRWWMVIAVLALVATACSGGGGGDDDDDAAGDDTEQGADGGEGEGWTILQYQLADNNLEPFMMQDMDEAGQVGSNERFDMVALVDRSPDYGDDPVLGLDPWVGAKLVHVGEGEGEEIEDLGDVDMGDPQTLTDFIVKGVEQYPSAHYALFISDHGASWPGVGPDETAGNDVLSLEELQGAIASGLEGAGIDKLDLLGFDACLMASYEVASTMASVADRLVASSELEPGHGWNYGALSVVADDGDATTDDLGTAIVDGFLEQAQEQGTDNDITLALLDLTKMGEVDAAMADLTSALVERSATVSPVVGRSLAQNPGYGRSPDPSMDTHQTDLGALVGAIGVDALDVSDQADGVLRAIGDVVVHKISGPAAPDFSGLSIYFPPENLYFNEDYRSIPATPGGWTDFLDAYYGAGEAIPPSRQAAFSDERESDYSFEDGGIYIEGYFDIDSLENISDAYVEYGVLEDDGTYTYIGDESAEISDDGSGFVEGFWDLTQLVLSDGENEAVAYLSLTSDPDTPGFSIEIPLVYYPPGTEVGGDVWEEVLLTVQADDDGNVVQETYYLYDAETSTYGEATLDPAGRLVPEVVQYDDEDDETWYETSETGISADLPNITYDFETLPSGTQIVIELAIEDFGGHRDAVEENVTIP